MDHFKQLNFNELPEGLVNAKYAVRGLIYQEAKKIKEKGGKIVYMNIGNPQAVGQKPLTFIRQFYSLIFNSILLQKSDQELVQLGYPSDVISRVRAYLADASNSIGAYADSRGLSLPRHEIANFIDERDNVSNFTTNPENIFLGNGASDLIQSVLKILIRDRRDGIMIPIPQYPLYSATIELYEGSKVGYYLDEDTGWSVSLEELQRAYDEAAANGVIVRGLVMINPGNPTGKVFNYDTIRQVIQFCWNNNIILLSDEVYQANIYTEEAPFISARKVLLEMGEPYSTQQELCSFHSLSKGMHGECGLRGGYMNALNIDQDVLDVYYKGRCVTLCSNTVGMIGMGLIANPPKEGDESFPLYNQELTESRESLGRRGKMITDLFNSLNGVSCQMTDAAMYSFPRITLPDAAISKAREEGIAPDTLYCLELLREEGICATPGSGFNQVEGTFHFRCTILPKEEEFPEILEKLRRFHNNFIERYSSTSKL